MTADQNPDGIEEAQKPGRTLADAVAELRGLLGMKQARDRAGRDARQLERLQAQSARRRAAVADPMQSPETS